MKNVLKVFSRSRAPNPHKDKLKEILKDPIGFLTEIEDHIHFFGGNQMEIDAAILDAIEKIAPLNAIILQEHYAPYFSDRKKLYVALGEIIRAERAKDITPSAP